MRARVAAEQRVAAALLIFLPDEECDRDFAKDAGFSVCRLRWQSIFSASI
jgi:hypothetical protein